MVVHSNDAWSYLIPIFKINYEEQTEPKQFHVIVNTFKTLRLKFSIIIGHYWRVPEGSKSSGEKIISTGELLNFYQNINSTGGFSIPLE